MKKQLFVAIIILISFNGFSQFGVNRIKKFEVKEDGFNIEMNFQPIVNRLSYNGLSIKIVPVSTDELNTALLNESFLNGQFSYSHYNSSVDSYFLKKKRGRHIKSDLEFFLEGISWLLDNDKINQTEYNKLEKQIIYFFDKDFAEEYYNSNKITSCNPYYINRHYLTVFKIKISNPTSSHIIFDRDLVVENGDILLNQLSSNELLQNLDLDEELNIKKWMSLKRHNFNRGIVIPPKSDIEKLFAVLPIDFNNPLLQLSIEGQQNKFSWKIIKKENEFNTKSIFYEINAIYKGSYTNLFNIISGDNTKNVFIDREKLFIGEDSLNSVFDIVSVSVYRKTFLFGRNKDIEAIRLVDLEKNKRGSLKLEHEKIDELTKIEKE